MIELALPLPPMLLEGVGYRGSDRFVGLYWTPYGDELIWFDGSTETTGDYPTFLALLDHPLTSACLHVEDIDRLTLGSSDTEATHALLCDRQEETLSIGTRTEVSTVARSQPTEFHAIAAELRDADGDDAQLVERFMDEIKRRAAKPPSRAEVYAALKRQRELTEALVLWLNAVARHVMEDS